MKQDLNLCYSRNDEDFNWDDFGSFLHDVKNDYEEPKVGDSYWAAPFRHVSGNDLVDSYTVERILEEMGERANDLLGEVYDAYDPIVSEEACEELEKFLIDWAERHNTLGRYWTIVGKSTEHKFTAEDLE